tara:strand:- start:173 stop:394 length:222 start_codon:yes stop_codon:yes gene_type:complete
MKIRIQKANGIMEEKKEMQQEDGVKMTVEDQAFDSQITKSNVFSANTAAFEGRNNNKSAMSLDAENVNQETGK